ncbi:nitrilase-related carbon-nitrogen hydrolase [Candidatus Poribacteria bacterium]
MRKYASYAMVLARVLTFFSASHAVAEPVDEAASVGEPGEDTGTLTMGLVQMSLEGTLTGNRDKIVRFIQEARSKDCRVVVFPEGALFAPPDTSKKDIDSAIAVIQEAAVANEIYVILNMHYRKTDEDKLFYSLMVIGPEGKVVQWYHKNPGEAAPGGFFIDDIPCSAMICSDRWSREIEELPVMSGSKILFECSNNYAIEWVPDLEWFWYMPRALRNNVYAVFVNTARNPNFEKFEHLNDSHGHTAVIAPDGGLVSALGEEPDQLLVTTIDVSKATAEEAMKRRDHPVFKPFWEVGMKILDGGSVDVPPVEVYESPEANVKIAAAQLACSRSMADNVERMKKMIHEARANSADVIIFPELAITGAEKEDVLKADQETLDKALAEIQMAAKTERIYVIFGMPYFSDGKRQNCAFVLSPEGELLTRYAQIVMDDTESFEPGSNAEAMWFRLKGVPAVVTVGCREALWNEIAELVAIKGAQVHFHICYDRDITPERSLIRKQIWANMASFQTFTATVNAGSSHELSQPSSQANGGSIIWEDFRKQRGSGPYPYCAVPVAQAGTGEQIIYAERTVGAKNPESRAITSKWNRRQMKDWYKMGVRIINADE